MKKILLATTVLVGTAGFAAAEVTLSGSARMGIVNDGTDTQFSSRIRVNFGLAGETDGGLSFGASVRADQAGTANSGGTAMDAGSVFVSGAFGKISMGDNDSAAKATVRQVDGVGYTGNGDLNEVSYLGQTDTSVLYTYSAGDLSFAASVGQLDTGEDAAYSVAASYTMGDYKIAAGLESNPASGYPDDIHSIIGASAKFGAIGVKAIYGSVAGDSQYALSASYTADALTLTAFASDDEELGGSEAYGFGVGYDLGGGAAASAGWSQDQTDDYSRYEAGLTFSF